MKKLIVALGVAGSFCFVPGSVLCMMSMKPKQKERAIDLKIIDLSRGLVKHDCGAIEERKEILGNKKGERLEQERLELAWQRNAVERGVAQEADEQKAALESASNSRRHWVFDINWWALGVENVAAAGKECVFCAGLFAKDRGNAFETAIGRGIKKFEGLKSRGRANAHRVKELSCYAVCREIMLEQCATNGITDKTEVEHSICLLTMMVQELENADLLNDKFTGQ